MKSAIAGRAGVGPSAVELTIWAGSVVVRVSIQTSTAAAASVQSAMAIATSSPSSATAILASVTGIPIAVLAIVTPPTVADVPPPPPPSTQPPPLLPPYPLAAGTASVSNTVDLTSALANTAVSHIVLAPGTYYLSAELNITRSVVLKAAVAGSVVLNAQASYSSQRRVVNIKPGPLGVVQLIGLSITGGYVSGFGCNAAGCTTDGVGGGGIAVWGGTVTISSSSIYGNAASYASGGGVFVQGGTVAISSCSISGNTAPYSGGGVYVSSGAVTITCSSIYGNGASSGGGVFVSGGTVTISSCTISENRAGSAYCSNCLGGGVCVNGGTVSIVDSQVYSNQASSGGNLYVDRQCPPGVTVCSPGGTVCSSTTLTDVSGPVSTCSPSPHPQRPPCALNSADGDNITILIIGVLSAIVGLLCCLALVCWWTRRRRREVELRRKDVNNWLRNMSVSTVSADEPHAGGSVDVAATSIPSGSGGGGGGGGGVTVSVKMSDRFVHHSSKTERSSRPDGTIVHEQPWRCSSASSAPNLSVAADFHDHHVDVGKHQLNDYELRKEGDDDRA